MLNPLTEILVDSPLKSLSSPALDLLPINDLPITLQKGSRFTHNRNPIYNFVNNHHLSSPYSTFIYDLSSVSFPKNTNEALSHPGKQ